MGLLAFSITNAAGFDLGVAFALGLPAPFWRDSGELLRRAKVVDQRTEPDTRVGGVVNPKVVAQVQALEQRRERSARRSRLDGQIFRDPACHRPARMR